MRPAPLILLASLTMLLVPGAVAETGALAAPSVAYPGTTVILTFTFGGSALAEVTFMESVSCLIAFPDGTDSPCEERASLLDVRVQGSERTYKYALAAPDVPGRYTATMTRAAPVDVALPPGETAQLQTTFEIVPEPLAQTDTPSGDLPPTTTPPAGETPPGTTPPPGTGTDDPTPPPDASAASWLATLGMAAVAMLGSIALAWRGG